MMKPILKFYTNMRRCCNSFLQREDGMAAVEASFLFPIMIMMLVGTVDVGQGITLNQRVITASQVCADLIARNQSVTDSTINEAIEAARLVFQVDTTGKFGVDIVSLRFDEDQNPEIQWRETRNISPNDTAVASTAGVFKEGEGLIIVTVKFDYEPIFSGEIIDDFTMQEVAFARGRRNPVVSKL
jgi:hypothetical protein